MEEKKETKEELRRRIRRDLVECGIDPDIEDYKQLQSDDRLLKVCRKRVEDIEAHRKALADLKPSKTGIAEEAGLSRTSISGSHNPNLLKIYNSFFAKEADGTVTASEYEKIRGELEDARKRLEGNAVTQARLMTALHDNRKLENKIKLQEQSIKNLSKIINKLKQMHLEQTGEALDVNVTELLTGPEENEEVDLRRKIPVPMPNQKGLSS